jgi:NAD(P)-dependent dehydrogenase (short-subunit alcohol dehydrogenase family)
LVTGGGSGIGAAACLALGRAGAAVAVVDYRRDAADETAEQLTREGSSAFAVAADVTDEGTVADATAQTVEQFGGLHVVCANAGINGMQTPIEEMSIDEWCETLDTNLTGTFLTVKHAIPHLRQAGGGSIIVTSSMNGNRLFSAPGFAAYSTSKAGQVAFTKMAAIELARWDIRVNTILPGSVRTNIQERTYRRNRDRVDWGVQPPDRWPPLRGTPADAADAADLIHFLASDASRHITGAEIVIDGGQSLLKG